MTRPTPSGTTPDLRQQQVPPPNARNAALRGATSAFTKPKTESLEWRNGTGSHGTATAAASAGRCQRSERTSPVSVASWIQIEPRAPQELANRRSSFASTFSSAASSSLDHSRSSHNRGLCIPSNVASARARSPSNIAAGLAAARQLSRSETRDIIPPAGAVGEAKERFGLQDGALKESRLRAPGQVVQQSKLSMHANEKTDSTSIAPTTTLVQLFEHAISSTQAGQREKPVVKSQGPAPAIESPKPTRVIHSRKLSLAGEKLPSSPQEDDSVGDEIQSGATGTSVLAKHKKHANSKRRAPSLVLNGSNQQPSIAVLNEPLNHASKNKIPQPSFKSAPEKRVSRPDVPPPRKSKQKLEDGRSVTQFLRPLPDPLLNNSRANSSLAVPRHAPDSSKPQPKPITRQESELQSFSQRRVTPHMTGDSLANAIVGAALASSRAPTPAISPAPRPPLPKLHTTSHHPFHLHNHKSRTPSPSKGFTRTTLRATSSDDEEVISRGAKPKGLFARKHPNKHHEGSRKRWRDQITERERKRYEGLWAANRGLYIPFSAIELASLARHNSTPAEAGKDLVSNLVVRDVWSKSRLPDHVLEEVWDLVDSEGKGRLAREEFVVGLWLIDQRLKGRKLPFKVGESLWASVRTVKGVLVPRKFK